MKISAHSFSKLATCATLLLALGSCSGGGSGGGSTTAPPPAPPTLTIISPHTGDSLPTGPVLVTFDIQHSPVTTAALPRMYFYVDNDPVEYKFYDGPGITTEGSTSGARYQGNHTHYVHWESGTSIELNALASGPHQVRFVLVDQAATPLIGTEKTLAFTILPGTTGGEFSLLEVASGLNVPVQMATAPDGRIFVSEQSTGNIRVVTPAAAPPWQVQTTPFATLPVAVGGEQGLLGIAVHPNFSSNGFVYVFYTSCCPGPGGEPVNHVVRFTATTNTNGETVATAATPDMIFDNLPAHSAHNGGILHFGPDGMLYIFVGENQVSADAQSFSSLRGKFLRIDPNGGIPADNPFFTLPAPFSAIYSLGHRNSFGFTFHPHTNDLWETENGPEDSDEINRIIAGGNYAWDATERRGTLNDPCCVDPIAVYFPAPPCDPLAGSCTIAPTGIVAIREDSVYPAQYYNNLLFADFNSGKLRRIVLGGTMLTTFVSDNIACDCGRGPLFAVMHGLNVPGQDGYIYVTNQSSIFRVILK